MKSLFKMRFRQFKNGLRQVTVSKFFLFFTLIAMFLGLMLFICIKLFGFIYKQETFPMIFKLFLCEKILTMTFLTMFMMLILSALISTLNIFFLSKDLHLLLSSPLSSRKVFLWKSIEVAISSSIMVLFFTFPALFGYSYYFAPKLIDIAGIAGIFVLYIVCGVALGIIVGLIVPAFISVKKLQPVLSVVSILFISGIVIFLRMLRPEQFGNPDAINDIVQYMANMEIKSSVFFPFYWISHGLHKLALGEYREFLKDTFTFGGTIIALGAFLFFLQKKYYLPLFDKLNKGSSGGFKSKWNPGRLFSSDYSALFKKEVKTFLRTPAQWSQLLVIGAIIIVFILNIKGMPIPHPSVKNLVAYLNLGMAAFTVVGLNSRFSFPALLMENPGLVHVFASPFSRDKIFRFKLLFYMIPHAFVGFLLFLLGDAALNIDGFARFTGYVFLVPVLPVVTLLAVYFSLQVADNVPLTPQNLIVSRGGVMYMLWSMVYIVLGMVYFVRPLFLYYYYTYAGMQPPSTEIAIWYIMFPLLNLVLFVFLYKRSISIWRRKEISSPVL